MCIRDRRFTVTVSNAIKQEHSDVGSSNIGLRNVQRMMQMMDGEMLLTKKTSSDSPGTVSYTHLFTIIPTLMDNIVIEKSFFVINLILYILCHDQ